MKTGSHPTFGRKCNSDIGKAHAAESRKRSPKGRYSRSPYERPKLPPMPLNNGQMLDVLMKQLDRAMFGR